MKNINLLTNEVFNKISAGEVVENPASVVKELIENSIDAGASEICISIEKGGKNLIEIKDNGVGIASEDIETAFLPHATSKISSAKDLENILTLGFRGEALASVSAVSIIEVFSKHITEEIGSYLKLVSGKKEKKEPTVINGGTTIKVENLFYNTPARLKFLKKDKSEESEITNIVKKLALSNYYVSFIYKIDGTISLQTNGDGLLNAIYSIYGKEVIKEILSIESTYYSYKIKGYISTPKLTKSTKNYGTLIINGRIVNNIAISTAISNAYGNLLMKRNYPIYVLELEIPSEDIDVNVTPSKTDVRFINSNRVYSLVYYAIKNALSEKVDSYNFNSILVENNENNSNLNTNTVNTYNNCLNLELSSNKSCENKDLFQSNNNSTIENNISDSLEFSRLDNNADSLEFFRLDSVTESLEYDKNCFNKALKKGSEIHLDAEFVNTNNSFKSNILNSKNNISTTMQNGLTKNIEYLPYNNPMISNKEENKSCFSSEEFSFDKCKEHKKENNNQNENFNNKLNIKPLSNNSNLDYNNIYSNKSIKNYNISDDSKFELNTNLIENESFYKSFQDEMIFNNEISLKDLTIYGQIFNTYLAIGYREDLFLIDQHAYHERILFDKLVDSFELSNMKCQDLLVSKKIEITASEFEKMEALQTIFSEIGFGYTINEDKCYIEMFKMPIIFNEINIEDVIDGILSVNNVTKGDLLVILKEQFAQQSCKKAIKGGDKLSEHQISWIIQQFKNKNILLCPHGRPIVVKLEKQEIDKMFKRII